MSEAFDGLYCGKNVFVTGHTGFKGAWLCMWLRQLGANVTGYALDPPTSPSLFEIAEVQQDLCRHHLGDLRDETRMLQAMEECNPDIVLHLAAQTVVRTGYEFPRETFDVNVMGTISVLECVRQLNRPMTVLFVSSDKCYENREQVWGYRETDAFGDHDPYGGSKGAAEIAVRSWRSSFFSPGKVHEHGVKLASARAGNVIGGGDWTPHALIVDLMRSLVEGDQMTIRNPDAYRPWQHVLQALSGYLTLVARMHASSDADLCEGFNIGPLPGQEMSVRQVVQRFIELWGHGSWIDGSDPRQLREARLLHVAIDKAMQKLRWKPSWNVEKALHQTVEWYREYHVAAADPRGICLDQIATYTSDMLAGGNSDNSHRTDSKTPVGVGMQWS